MQRSNSDDSLNTERPLEMQRLENIRTGLLDLHKILLDNERQGYERVFGKIASNSELLRLLIEDPWFAWLRPLSQLVAGIDEALDAEPPITNKEIEGFLRQARALLTPSEEGAGFAKNYHDALQEEPDVIMAHAAILKLFA